MPILFLVIKKRSGQKNFATPHPHQATTPPLLCYTTPPPSYDTSTTLLHHTPTKLRHLRDFPIRHTPTKMLHLRDFATPHNPHAGYDTPVTLLRHTPTKLRHLPEFATPNPHQAATLRDFATPHPHQATTPPPPSYATTPSPPNYSRHTPQPPLFYLIEIVELVEVVLVLPGAQQREEVPVDTELLCQRLHLLHIKWKTNNIICSSTVREATSRIYRRTSLICARPMYLCPFCSYTSHKFDRN